jgi:hypothetical protein
LGASGSCDASAAAALTLYVYKIFCARRIANGTTGCVVGTKYASNLVHARLISNSSIVNKNDLQKRRQNDCSLLARVPSNQPSAQGKARCSVNRFATIALQKEKKEAVRCAANVYNGSFTSG